jgi:sulfite reductase (NADPH) hemoprotein beta-component
VIVARVPASQKAAIDALVKEYGLDHYDSASPLRLESMACVALPTCTLAMAESERYLPSLLDKLDAQFAQHGLSKETVVVRMTGCPNGCARPFLAEIGFVGKALGRYNLYLGGNRDGSRLNKLFKENIDEATILSTLDPILARFAKEKNSAEGFGNFVVRSGIVAEVKHGSEVHG